jgi:hypothetical protein
VTDFVPGAQSGAQNQFVTLKLEFPDAVFLQFVIMIQMSNGKVIDRIVNVVEIEPHEFAA